MKFTIGTASSSMEFEEDIRLIKSSLLYADEIELIGMAEYAIFNYLPKCLLSTSDFDSVISNLISLLSAFDNEEAKALLSQLENIQDRFLPYLPQLKKRKTVINKKFWHNVRFTNLKINAKKYLVQLITGL